jgi:hypothetical protein
LETASSSLSEAKSTTSKASSMRGLAIAALVAAGDQLSLQVRKRKGLCRTFERFA